MTNILIRLIIAARDTFLIAVMRYGVSPIFLKIQAIAARVAAFLTSYELILIFSSFRKSSFGETSCPVEGLCAPILRVRTARQIPGCSEESTDQSTCRGRERNIPTLALSRTRSLIKARARPDECIEISWTRHCDSSHRCTRSVADRRLAYALACTFLRNNSTTITLRRGRDAPRWLLRI